MALLNSLFGVVVALVVVNVALLVQCYTSDPSQMKDDCYISCTVNPNSVKCFRCKNRLPMRFGKRSSPFTGLAAFQPYFGNNEDGRAIPWDNLGAQQTGLNEDYEDRYRRQVI